MPWKEDAEKKCKMVQETQIFIFFFRISVFKNTFQAVNTIYTIIMFSSKKQLNDN